MARGWAFAGLFVWAARHLLRRGDPASPPSMRAREDAPAAPPPDPARRTPAAGPPRRPFRVWLGLGGAAFAAAGCLGVGIVFFVAAAALHELSSAAAQAQSRFSSPLPAFLDPPPESIHSVRVSLVVLTRGVRPVEAFLVGTDPAARRITVIVPPPTGAVSGEPSAKAVLLREAARSAVPIHHEFDLPLRDLGRLVDRFGGAAVALGTAGPQVSLSGTDVASALGGTGPRAADTSEVAMAVARQLLTPTSASEFRTLVRVLFHNAGTDASTTELLDLTWARTQADALAICPIRPGAKGAAAALRAVDGGKPDAACDLARLPTPPVSAPASIFTLAGTVGPEGLVAIGCVLCALAGLAVWAIVRARAARGMNSLVAVAPA
jgi:hypothetical protein